MNITQLPIKSRRGDLQEPVELKARHPETGLMQTLTEERFTAAGGSFRSLEAFDSELQTKIRLSPAPPVTWSESGNQIIITLTSVQLADLAAGLIMVRLECVYPAVGLDPDDELNDLVVFPFVILE